MRTDGKVTLYPYHRNHDLNFASQVLINIPKGEKDKIAGSIIYNLIMCLLTGMITQEIRYKKILECIRGNSRNSNLLHREERVWTPGLNEKQSWTSFQKGKESECGNRGSWYFQSVYGHLQRQRVPG